MSYLYPPPGDAPVVVYKDVGGYVDQYDRQTALYFQTNREVRLHECRSACTLALALPNVCVYPDSLLKFHKAYNPQTRDANDFVSDAMMAAYPVAVRQRLGQLTRNYKVLTGSELIRLGVRDCNAPQQPRVMVARARLKDNPPENPVSNAFGGLMAALTPQSSLATVAQVRMASVRPVSVKPQVADAPPPAVLAQAPKPPPTVATAIAATASTPASASASAPRACARSGANRVLGRQDRCSDPAAPPRRVAGEARSRGCRRAGLALGPTNQGLGAHPRVLALCSLPLSAGQPKLSLPSEQAQLHAAALRTHEKI